MTKSIKTTASTAMSKNNYIIHSPFYYFNKNAMLRCNSTAKSKKKNKEKPLLYMK